MVNISVETPIITPTTIINETIQEIPKEDFLTKITPFMPYIIILSVIAVMGVIAYLILKNNNQLFKKDYDKENYKNKLKTLGRNSPKVFSSKWWILGGVFVISTILTSIIIIGLYFLEIIEVFPIIPLITIPLIISFVFLLWVFAKPSFFNKYNKVWTITGDFIGYQLSHPVKNPLGFSEMLIFKNMKWLFFKDIEILSIPTGENIKLPIPKKNEKGESLSTSFKCKIPVNKRFFKNNDNDYIVNSENLIKTRFFIYPLFTNTDKFNFDEIIFLKEKYEGDIINLSDIANATRENAISLLGSNPYVKIPNAQQQKDSDNE